MPSLFKTKKSKKKEKTEKKKLISTASSSSPLHRTKTLGRILVRSHGEIYDDTDDSGSDSNEEIQVDFDRKFTKSSHKVKTKEINRSIREFHEKGSGSNSSWEPDEKLIKAFEEKLKKTLKWNDISKPKKEEVLDRSYPSNALAFNQRLEALEKWRGKYTLSEQYTYDFALVLTIIEAQKCKTEKQANQRQIYLKECCKMYHLLKYAGLKQFLYKSKQDDELYILIGGSEDVLRKHAERLEFDLELDSNAILEHGKKMIKLTGRPPLQLIERIQESNSRSDNFTKNDMLNGLFAKYVNHQHKWKSKLYKRQGKCMNSKFHKSTLFTEIQRLKITKAIIEADYEFIGANLNIAQLVNLKSSNVLAFFPLHDSFRKERLLQRCFESWTVLFHPPNDEMREYFGEQVALYFEFLSFYTTWLVPASFLGLGFSAWQMAAGTVNIWGTMPFGVFMLIWSTLLFECWGQKEAILRTKWGTHRHREKESTRADFEGDIQPCPITGKPVQRFSKMKKLQKLIVSQSIVIVFILSVLAVVLGLFLFKIMTIRTLGPTNIWVLVAPGVANGVVIMLLNTIFTVVSFRLNEYENHRTETEFENALISKVFLFKLVNSFSSLLFIAFIKRHQPEMGYCKGSYLAGTIGLLKSGDKTWYQRIIPQGKRFSEPPEFKQWAAIEGLTDIPCVEWSVIKHSKKIICQSWAMLNNPKKGWDYRGDCLVELSSQLAIIFATQICVGNALEIGIPFLKSVWKSKNEGLEITDRNLEIIPLLDREISDAELQYVKEQYDGTFSDYDEMVVQFGYVLLFVAAFPATPFLALINNILEFRIDTTKVINITRRPYPRGAYDIGTWRNMLMILGYIAVITNMSLWTILPSVILPEGEYSTLSRLLIFLAVEHMIVSAKILVTFVVPDIPSNVKHQQDRAEHIRETMLV